MADYCTPTVVQQTIPKADMTPLEHLILGRIFNAEPDGDGVYFFAEEEPRDVLDVPAADLKATLAASAGINSFLNAHVAQLLKEPCNADTEVEIDLSLISYGPILQDIVRRSRTLRYVTVVSAFTCSKMRPDGFGGMAFIITADAMKAKSTNDILEEYIGEIEAATPPTAP